MVLSMLLAITTAPALLGTQEAIRQSQSKNRREEHRAQRCNLMVHCLSPSSRSHELNNKTVVLKGSKVGGSWFDRGTSVPMPIHTSFRWPLQIWQKDE